MSILTVKYMEMTRIIIFWPHINFSSPMSLHELHIICVTKMFKFRVIFRKNRNIVTFISISVLSKDTNAGTKMFYSETKYFYVHNKGNGNTRKPQKLVSGLSDQEQRKITDKMFW